MNMSIVEHVGGRNYLMPKNRFVLHISVTGLCNTEGNTSDMLFKVEKFEKKIAKFAKNAFAKFSKTAKFHEIYHKNSLIWKMNYSYMHQCIKEGINYK